MDRTTTDVDSYRMRDKGQELRMSVLQVCKIDGTGQQRTLTRIGCEIKDRNLG
jgi:hypothetical protein